MTMPPPINMQSLLNSIASGPPPNIPQGVTRVSMPNIHLGGIGSVPVPDVPIAPPPVVPGKPLPTGGGGGDQLGNYVPGVGGPGNIIGTGKTAQIAGPRGDRTLLSNIPRSTEEMLGNRVGGNQGFQQLANAITAGGGQLGTGTLAKSLPKEQPQPQAQRQAAPAPHVQHMANATGYTGSFDPGQYESWLSAQPSHVRQQAHTAFGQAATMAPMGNPGGTSLGSLLEPRRNA